ncbi:MAG: helix-turn-helix transcriptional regulator [Candidatus Omnitrophica bacterium]|nr:helix-turn-helix transcriptional regulator [Candidatus Omnitrophota bacterium]
MTQAERAFGIVIRRRRHKLGLSQEAYAERAEVHRTYISSVELGKVSVGIGVAARLARALGVSLSRLFEDVERERSAHR